MPDEAPSLPVETMAERHGRLLGRLAELSLAACEDLAARAAATEEPKLAAELHATFAKAGRCLRQTVMLEAKLAQAQADQRRASEARARPAPAFAPRPAAVANPDRADAREDLLAQALGDEITEQLEGAERAERLERLDELLQTEREKPGFVTEPLEAVVLRLCEGLGLAFGARPEPAAPEPPPEQPPELKREPPDPPPEPEPEPDPPDPPPDPPPVYAYPWDHPRAQYGGSHGGTGW